MRVIMYHPRFPTNNVVPPELDALPSATFTQTPLPTTSTSNQHITFANGTGGGHTHTAPSTVYRVSTTGITVNNYTSHSHNRSRSGSNATHGGHGSTSAGAGGQQNGGRPTVRSHRSDTVSSATSQNTIHGRQRSSSSAQNHERSTTPTQSNTLAHAKDQERPKLDASDLGSLTAEQIAQLQANMLEDIQDADSRPLVSTVQPMEVLMAEYSTNPNFLKKMEWLKKQNWLGYRRTKGDGDCFYRSFAFAWVERILRARDRELAVAAGVSTLHTTFLSLGEVGFDTMVFEDFYEVLKSLVVQIVTPEPDGQTLNASLLLEAFTSPEASNSIVSYMRMITSAELRKNAPEYEAFILHPDTQEPMPVADFCSMFVEGMGKEADHVQMQALAKTMGVNLSVAYLDGSAGTSEDGSVDFVKFENGGGNEANGIDDVVLLYRPGHYDILEHRAHEHRPSAASALVTPSVME